MSTRASIRRLAQALREPVPAEKRELLRQCGNGRRFICEPTGRSWAASSRTAPTQWDRPTTRSAARTATCPGTRTIWPTWFRRNVRHVCEGGWRRRPLYFATVVSQTSMPSFSVAMNPRRAPARVRLRHRANQRTDVGRHRRAPHAAPALPGPSQSEAPSVPGDDGLRLDDHQCRSLSSIPQKSLFSNMLRLRGLINTLDRSV